MAGGLIGRRGGLGAADELESADYAPMAEINVTPMVDVMLVLLIIFMVAAPLMMVGVPVDLPRTAAAKIGQPQKPVVVSIDHDGKVFAGRDLLPAGEVVSRLAALHGETPDAPVYVRADRAIPYGRVMEVMGQVGQAGFARVSLIAEAPPGGGAH
jgi:biopolymer transport protein TolR